MLKCVFHIHTEYSNDSYSRIGNIINICKNHGINCIFPTDHNTIKGSVELKKHADFKVIVGSEIKTKQGEIIGLFLEEEIPKGLSIDETIKLIREQGGITVLPHPYGSFRLAAMSEFNLLGVLDDIDIIEVFNARNLFRSQNRRALELAEKYEKTQIIGNDAHFTYEVNGTHFTMKDFDTKEEFLKNLSVANFYTKYATKLVHMKTIFIKYFWKKIFNKHK